MEVAGQFYQIPISPNILQAIAGGESRLLRKLEQACTPSPAPDGGPKSRKWPKQKADQ